MTLGSSRKINRENVTEGKKRLRRAQEQKTWRTLLASEGYRLKGVFDNLEGRSESKQSATLSSMVTVLGKTTHSSAFKHQGCSIPALNHLTKLQNAVSLQM